MIASIGNNYTAGIFARSSVDRSSGAIFGNSSSGLSSAVGQNAYSPTVQNSASAFSAGDGNQPDFTSMTRQQLRDWTNDQIKSGKMTFDDGSALALMSGMSGKVSVEGTSMDDEALTNEKINFIDLAQSGIAGAQSRGDQKAISRLQKALTLMDDNRKPAKTDDISTESSAKLKEALEAFKKEASLTPAQRARRDVLKAMNLTDGSIAAMPAEQQKATEQKIAAEVVRRLRLGESGKDQVGSTTASDPLTPSA